MDELQQLAENPRVTVRRQGRPDAYGKCIVYWMQRSQRALDNPALETAVQAANALGKPCVVFLAPVPFYPHANLRHYAFLQQGIPAIAQQLEQRGIGFVLRRYPDHHLAAFCQEVRPSLVVGDENPLREPRKWRELASRQLGVPFWTVDADVIVPSRLLLKEQYAARTARPVISRLSPEFLVPVGNTRARMPWQRSGARKVRSLAADTDITKGWTLDRSVQPVEQLKGGTEEGLKRLKAFLRRGLATYVKDRNRPELDATSHLSPYLHFGHLGPHTVALAVEKAEAPGAAKAAFLEQLVVRRELAINFVHFNSDYDNFECAEPWAHRSLAQHSRDQRQVYSERELEEARTHDPLWNAAQQQMVFTGWMHNYMRMYWAKKILEWSRTPAEAFRIAVAMNDKYELDGRDPNGYAGIAWAIVGKHDRPWFDRPIFGHVRYMSFASTSKKFDSRRYIEQMRALAKAA